MSYEIQSDHSGWFVALDTGYLLGPFGSQLQADVEGGIIALQMANASKPLSYADLQALAAESNCHCRLVRSNQAS